MRRQVIREGASWTIALVTVIILLWMAVQVGDLISEQQRVLELQEQSMDRAEDRMDILLDEIRAPTDDTERFLLFRRTERIEALLLEVCAATDGCEPPAP